ncbi:Phosphoglucomutase-2 [Eumeta japonica]|uniref:Phosphoglucomutase-2 n=1 Tax=Eumeta variegata TaxID=151549 RepID=A0A4C1S875_EUMVA|nr:Phosphoglucomutase-2 [Eumeta japonica]
MNCSQRSVWSRFAELTAGVFTKAGIPVRLFSAVCPTPFISFATIKYRCAAGVMVTASHNPKEDNGYKVYWGNGSQIIAPHDDNILEEIDQNLDIPDEHWDITDIRKNIMVIDCTEEVTSSYMNYLQECLSKDVLEKNRSTNIRTVYSAMHGVGHKYIQKAFQAANLKNRPVCTLKVFARLRVIKSAAEYNKTALYNFILFDTLISRTTKRIFIFTVFLSMAGEPLSVKEQQEPDPEFPTVKFPNPEEVGCLELSQRLAQKEGVNLVLVNDPDADRLAVAEYQPRFAELILLLWLPSRLSITQRRLYESKMLFQSADRIDIIDIHKFDIDKYNTKFRRGSVHVDNESNEMACDSSFSTYAHEKILTLTKNG